MVGCEHVPKKKYWGIMPTQFTVTAAAPEEHPLLERLVQLYLYDTSVCEEADMDQAGMYTGPNLAAYWHAAEHVAFLFRLGCTPVGFALVGNRSRFHSPYAGHTLDALFVLRRYRRQRFGQTAAHTIFTQFPGEWEIVAPAINPPAQSFWRAVVDRYTDGRYHERWLQTREFRGNVQSFVAAQQRPAALAVFANGCHSA